MGDGNVSNIIEMIPLVGIKMQKKSINLLDLREKVKLVLGRPYGVHKNSYYYFNNELRIDFNKQGLVEFIEILSGVDGKIQPKIYGVKAFQIEANVLYEILKNENSGEIDDSENGYSYSFLNTSVGIYRETTPEDVEEMIEDAKEEGEPMDSQDIEYEIKKATHWDTIGIGVKDYYR